MTAGSILYSLFVACSMAGGGLITAELSGQKAVTEILINSAALAAGNQQGIPGTFLFRWSDLLARLIMLMLDLCCGLKGASSPMVAHGWDVVTVDVDPKFNPDIVTDLVDFRYQGKCPDLIWASPPCTEFSRESMPWCRTGNTPSMDLVFACKRIIDDVMPKYWIIENVKGAIKYFVPYYGRPRASFGPFFLWGWFPLSGPQGLQYRKKESFSSSDVAARAKIPSTVSEKIIQAIEMRPMLF